MMKKLLLFLLPVLMHVPFCHASIADDATTADGYLTEGEYEGSYITMEGHEILIVAGGGAERISANDHSYLEVQYTSTPLSNSSGIYDIMLGHNSELLYLDGITEEITIGNDAVAHLKGGRIDAITLYDHPNYSHEAYIYCRDGWSWLYEAGDISGITGLWENGTSFTIDFVDVGSPYPPTWEGIDIVIVPEPATLALLALGGLLIHRHK
ncbi:MAG: PEP-CTERM sorting domain-containing protein [Planctomycetota bacterium]|jgi:hypothetical protein